jgi:hypothetical protein
VAFSATPREKPKALGVSDNLRYRSCSRQQARQIVRQTPFIGLAIAILLACSPYAGLAQDFGVLLSPADYDYLAVQGVSRDSVVLQKMSPKELSRLHKVINDTRTGGNPQSRANAVRSVLAELEGNQRWENANPGRLWDEDKYPGLGKADR